MKVRFMCSDCTRLTVDNANINNLEAQCWARARRVGKVPTKPLVYEVVSGSGSTASKQKGIGNDDDNTTPPKEEWVQLKFKF